MNSPFDHFPEEVLMYLLIDVYHRGQQGCSDADYKTHLLYLVCRRWKLALETRFRQLYPKWHFDEVPRPPELLRVDVALPNEAEEKILQGLISLWSNRIFGVCVYTKSHGPDTFVLSTVSAVDEIWDLSFEVRVTLSCAWFLRQKILSLNKCASQSTPDEKSRKSQTKASGPFRMDGVSCCILCQPWTETVPQNLPMKMRRGWSVENETANRSYSSSVSDLRKELDELTVRRPWLPGFQITEFLSSRLAVAATTVEKLSSLFRILSQKEKEEEVLVQEFDKPVKMASLAWVTDFGWQARVKIQDFNATYRYIKSSQGANYNDLTYSALKEYINTTATQ